MPYSCMISMAERDGETTPLATFVSGDGSLTEAAILDIALYTIIINYYMKHSKQNVSLGLSASFHIKI